MRLQRGMTTTTMGGLEIVCFATTEELAFFAPITRNEKGVFADINAGVLVYQVENEGDEVASISAIRIAGPDNQVVDVEEVEGVETV